MTEHEKSISAVSWKMTVCAVAAALVFAAMMYIAVTGNGSSFDDVIRNGFYSIRAGWLTPAVRIITYTGNVQFIVGLCILLLAVKPVRVRYGLPVSAGAIAVTIVNKSIKHAVARPRPSDIAHLVTEGGFSFPSGHSITSMFVYGIMIYQVRRYVKDRRLANALTVLLAIPMLLIGPSRIYLGVHYPTDVIAGWMLGIIAIIICTAVMKKIAAKKNTGKH